MNWRVSGPRWSGPAYALSAAALFGASIPFAKVLLAAVDPAMLAGLFYLGAGVGLALVRMARTQRAPREAPLSRRDIPWFGAAILCGGVVGPLLLMNGLVRTDGATASLLLSVEGIMTALIAWFAFAEHFDRRVVLGMRCIAAGAMLVSWAGQPGAGGLLGPLLIVGACAAWGLDNNLTRKVALADPIEIAMLKGLLAGPAMLVTAVAAGAALPGLPVALAAAFVGLLGYGISLALFVAALRHLGTARTAAYFSTAPFLGAAVATMLLGEPVTMQLAAAALLMGIGVLLHLTERHEHEHKHEPGEHVHWHVHDEHHRHSHATADPVGEPHNLRHAHVCLRHIHRHVPDSHHRHAHGQT